MIKTPPDVAERRILDAVMRAPGLRAVDLRAASIITPLVFHATLRRLVAVGLVNKVGLGTRYSPASYHLGDIAGVAASGDRPSRSVRSVDLAYYAGIIDADGCIRIARNVSASSKNPHYGMSVKLEQIDVEAIAALADDFGGTIYTKRPLNKKHKLVYRWGLCALQAADFLEAILPYMRIKKPQADIAIDFARQMHSSTLLQRASGSKERDPLATASYQRMYEEIASLKHSDRFQETQ